MEYFKSRFIVELLIFVICQIILVVGAILLFKKCFNKYHTATLVEG